MIFFLAGVVSVFMFAVCVVGVDAVVGDSCFLVVRLNLEV